jgi:hypothetical protein
VAIKLHADAFQGWSVTPELDARFRKSLVMLQETLVQNLWFVLKKCADLLVEGKLKPITYLKTCIDNLFIYL